MLVWVSICKKNHALRAWREITWLMDKLKTEFDRMKQLDIIEEIDEPTEWVSSLVITEKADGRLQKRVLSNAHS